MDAIPPSCFWCRPCPLGAAGWSRHLDFRGSGYRRQKGLAIAIRKREFTVHYQPIIELATGRCIAAEALLRWRDPDGRWILPDSFIALAEETGLIAALTDLMIDRVVEDMGGPLHEPTGIFSRYRSTYPRGYGKRALPSRPSRHALKRSGDRAIANLARGHRAGFHACYEAAITAVAAALSSRAFGDDRRFRYGLFEPTVPAREAYRSDALKIDKSFIDAIAKDAATSVVTSHIIDMAHGLGYHIVAEGVGEA